MDLLKNRTVIYFLVLISLFAILGIFYTNEAPTDGKLTKSSISAVHEKL